MLETYHNKLNILKNKWKFIDEVNRQKIQLYNTPIDKIINILETKQYYKKDKCYDYLLNLNIRSFTKEKLSQIQEDIEQTQQQHQRLQSTTVSELWVQELEELEKKL